MSNAFAASNLTIRSRLPELCKAHGLSFYQLAKRIGRKPNTITRIARNERRPGKDLVVQLCSELNCQPGDLETVERIIE